MSCPQEPVPLWWSVWRGPVPTELTQLAMDVRDHVRSYKRGTIVQTLDYMDPSTSQHKTVGVFVSSHTWTYKRQPDGSVVLMTGICIPGVSLLVQQPLPTGVTANAMPVADDLSTPDPTAAVWGATDVPVSPALPVSGAIGGAGLGAILGGPLGAAIGAVAGALLGYLTAKSS